MTSDPYRTQGERTQGEREEKLEDSNMNEKLIKWTALTIMMVTLIICGTRVAIQFHEDRAELNKARMEIAESEAMRARAEADKAMWERMAPKQ
jgi:hypothetical protein